MDREGKPAIKLLILGYNRPGNVGRYLASAAAKLCFEYTIMDSEMAEATGRISRSFHWRFCGKRPAQLGRFGAQVIATCEEMRPDLVLATGRAPLERLHIEHLQALGATVVNYSTDDPWNARLRAPWFLAAIPVYDVIFTPRRANMEEFRKCGVRYVYYLPFGYDPDIHRPWPTRRSTDESSDVLFVGGCDSDRLPLITALIDAGFNVALFGGYWNRHIKTRPCWRGMGDQDAIRSASATARICLCLVRRANRDGHVMRSFEAAAIGGCILAEDTADHRELFGDAACYFATPLELIEQTRLLVDDMATRHNLAVRLRDKMTRSANTYADRLATIVRLARDTHLQWLGDVVVS